MVPTLRTMLQASIIKKRQRQGELCSMDERKPHGIDKAHSRSLPLKLGPVAQITFTQT
jgi:hypothetical protein